MESFKDWFNSQESSAFTRARNAAFLGLGPDIASPFSHSTPPPAMVDKLLGRLKKKKKKKRKLKENQGQAPSYDFDAFIKKLLSAKNNIDQEIEDFETQEEDDEDDDDDDDDEVEDDIEDSEQNDIDPDLENNDDSFL